MVERVRPRTSLIVTALFVALTFVVPAPASAAPSCQESAETLLEHDGIYVLVFGTSVQVWEESNGIEGLQTGPCEDNDGRERPADTLWYDIPCGGAVCPA